MPADRKLFLAVVTGNKGCTEFIWGDIEVCPVRHEQITNWSLLHSCLLPQLEYSRVLGTGTLGLSEQPAEGPSQVLSYTGAEKLDF